jgi:hypothetical protein
MLRISWLFLAAVSAGALVLAAQAGSVQSRPASETQRCYSNALPASIGGRRVCLSEGAPCRNHFERQYRRYLFSCPSRTLKLYWAGLRRPFLASPIPTGTRCPATTATGTLAVGGIEPVWTNTLARGPGPAYPTALGGEPTARFLFVYPPSPASGWEESGWGGSKNIWVVARTYHGPILVRGRQLDGPNDVRFQNGVPGFTRRSGLSPDRELRLRGPETHGWPSTTRLRAPGCYAFQVDGRGFSYSIVFEARIVS